MEKRYRIMNLNDKIKNIKQGNPGKFDHLPDPKPVNPLENWTEEEINDFQIKLNERFDTGKKIYVLESDITQGRKTFEELLNVKKIIK